MIIDQDRALIYLQRQGSRGATSIDLAVALQVGYREARNWLFDHAHLVWCGNDGMWRLREGVTANDPGIIIHEPENTQAAIDTSQAKTLAAHRRPHQVRCGLCSHDVMMGALHLGVAIEDIAKQAGVSTCTVRKWYQRQGVKLPDRRRSAYRGRHVRINRARTG